jgi:hypothetical protein
VELLNQSLLSNWNLGGIQVMMQPEKLAWVYQFNVIEKGA